MFWWLDQHFDRVFDESLEGVQQFRSVCSVEDTMVARVGACHVVCVSNVVDIHDRSPLAGTNGQDGRLRRIALDDG